MDCHAKTPDKGLSDPTDGPCALGSGFWRVELAGDRRICQRFPRFDYSGYNETLGRCSGYPIMASQSCAITAVVKTEF
jgi:hypothetical protein